jgi:hypothetical protein
MFSSSFKHGSSYGSGGDLVRSRTHQQHAQVLFNIAQCSTDEGSSFRCQRRYFVTESIPTTTDAHLIRQVEKESVASILERDGEITIQNWLEMVEQSVELKCIPLSRHERTGHLPKLLRDLIRRLRRDTGLPTPISLAARDHGEIRRQQGYTPPMVVEESRFLQVSIFGTLQRNMSSVDFSRVLSDVVTIADECDSQLKQAILSYGAAL